MSPPNLMPIHLISKTQISMSTVALKVFWGKNLCTNFLSSPSIRSRHILILNQSCQLKIAPVPRILKLLLTLLGNKQGLTLKKTIDTLFFHIFESEKMGLVTKNVYMEHQYAQNTLPFLSTDE